jgi:hypothetical protein
LMIILKWILKKREGGGVGWMNLAHHRDQWQAVVNEKINFWIP